MTLHNESQNDESLFPVFRFDLDSRLIFANSPANSIMQAWSMRMNERIPGAVISRFPELFHATLSHKPVDLTVEHKNYLIRFTIVPFPEARYIGMYAYSMEVNHNYTSKKVRTTEPAFKVAE